MSLHPFARLVALLAALALAPAAHAQFVSITGGNGATESFDSLASTGGTGTVVPGGWYFAENNAAGAAYTVSDGNSTSGDTYSFGSVAANDRAFGMIGSGSVVANIGARLQNDTGSTLSGLLVEFAGEQWRLGDINGADKLDFQYCTSTCALTDVATAANWTNVNELDFISPITTGTASTAQDGNLAASRTLKSFTLSGISLAPSAQIWIRWLDTNDGGVDDALAIDDVRIAAPGDFPPTVVSTTPATSSPPASLATNITIVFSEPVNTAGSWFAISCTVSGAHGAGVTGGPTTWVLNPFTDFASNETCTVTVFAAQVTDADEALLPMAADYVYDFDVANDVAPTVTSTVPADNATDVALSSGITVTFSEPVAVSGTWYQILCASSGAHPATVTGGPAIYRLDPNTGYTSGESCEVTLFAAQIQDTDGNANLMATNYLFDFTAAIDSPPAVASTVPADNATNVQLAANVVVTFSEPVTAPAGAFSIACGASGAHPFVLSGGPAAYTLNPDTDFSLLETCVVSIAANQVFDQDGVAQAAAATSFDFTTTGGAATYYSNVDASTPAALRTTLHAAIENHTAYPYTNSGQPPIAPVDVNDILDDADENPLNANEVLEVYENDHHPKAAAGNPNYNKEHTWPNSYGFNDLNGAPGGVPESSAYSDTHMLYLSDIQWNANRGSKPYATCTQASGCTVDATLAYNGHGGGATTYPGNHNWKKLGADGTNGCSSFTCEAYGSYEVWNHRRGDMARAVLYMDIRYEGGTATAGNTSGQFEPQLIVTDDRDLIYAGRSSGSTSSSTTSYMGLRSTLVQWHNDDPPDALEQARNELIYSWQGNRNPFIDHPEWVACLYATPPVCGGSGPDLMFSNGFE